MPQRSRIGENFPERAQFRVRRTDRIDLIEGRQIEKQPGNQQTKYCNREGGADPAVVDLPIPDRCQR
ncbi:MAG: hypothetical protein EBZ36_01105 [Acidobacteria bacterium]|nr:hypothetical protein [Acidobacteriota bacterium]